MLARQILSLPTGVATFFAVKFGIKGLGVSPIWPWLASIVVWALMALILPSSGWWVWPKRGWREGAWRWVCEVVKLNW